MGDGRISGGFDMNLKPEELVKALAEMEGKKRCKSVERLRKAGLLK